MKPAYLFALCLLAGGCAKGPEPEVVAVAQPYVSCNAGRITIRGTSTYGADGHPETPDEIAANLTRSGMHDCKVIR